MPQDDPKTENIISSVSTIVRKVLVQPEIDKEPSISDTNHEQELSIQTAFSITHVFTPEELRRKGYATRTMSLLHGQISQSSTATLSAVQSAHSGDKQTADEDSYPTGILSFLYSGVGDFYSRCGIPGWHIQKSTETYWDVEAVLSIPSSDTSLGDVRYLTEDDFQAIAKRDAELLAKEISFRAREGKPRAFAILPTGEEFTWLVARSKFYGQILSPHPLPEYWGVEVDEDNFAIWFIDFVKHELQFLRLRCSDGQKLTIMVKAAAAIAKEHQCPNIQAWNLDTTLLEDTKNYGVEVITRERTGNLAAVAWYANGECPEWIANEKYGWC